MKRIILGICIAAITTTLSAQDVNPQLYTFRFNDSRLDSVLDHLQKITGKDITVDLGVTATVTLETPEKVTADEATTIIIQALQEEGLAVEDLDENTLRVRESPTYEATPPGYIEEAIKRQEKIGKKPSPTTYGERRAQRMQNRRESADIPKPTETDEQLKKQLQAYQMEVIREGLTPLPVPLTPEQAAALEREGLTVPAEATASDDNQPKAVP